MKRILVSLILCGTILGCESYVPPLQQEVTLQEKPKDFLVAIALDLSGSFHHRMLHEGNAYKFFGAVIDGMYRDRIGKNDRIILAQISGNRKSMLWEGTAMRFGQQFPNPQALSKFLEEHSNPAGSNVWDGIADLVEYVNRYPGVATGKTPSRIFVLSDMEDNVGNAQSNQRLKKALTEYVATGGLVGMYWVEQGQHSQWSDVLVAAGCDECVVQMGIVETPAIPTFKRK